MYAHKYSKLTLNLKKEKQTYTFRGTCTTVVSYSQCFCSLYKCLITKVGQLENPE